MVLSSMVACKLLMKHWSEGEGKYNCIEVKRKVRVLTNCGSSKEGKRWIFSAVPPPEKSDTSWIFSDVSPQRKRIRVGYSARSFSLVPPEKKILPVRLSVDSLCNGIKFLADLHNLLKKCTICMPRGPTHCHQDGRE